ncbi:MAG: PD40 domain-containing protein [Anaerolineae bacterium]|nr:PD40 domain-containing protein [Anaerolineae bacterium]
MLTRAYRVTDKFGVLLLKSSIALGLWLMSGVAVVTNAGRRIFAGGLGGLAVLFGGALLIIRRIAGFIWVVLRGIGLVFARIFRLFFGGARHVSGQAARSAGATASTAMARRAARAELEASLGEDPLRVQNRVLSGLTVVLLAVLIGVVLWATNPARTSGTLPPADLSGQNFSFVSAGTAEGAPTVSALLATPVPTATALPSVLEVRGSLAYVVRENGQDDIWALGVGTRAPVRLTNNPADDRDPAWSPDGRRLAYASHQDGNWEIYIYDLATNATTRMTYDLSYQGAPQWSPDGQWLVYESYQGNNLDVYVVPVDGSQPARRVTENAQPDFSPAWSPDGRRIAFVSWRDGNQDIYVFSLDNPSDAASVNLTNTPTRQEDYPAWSPDGELLAYSALDEGIDKVFVKPSDDPLAAAQVLERGRQPSWSPNGASLVYAVESLEGTQLVVSPFTEAGVATLVVGKQGKASDPVWSELPLPAALVSSGGLPSGVAQALFVEQVAPPDQDNLYRLGQLLGVDVARASSPYLSDKVNDSFNALRQQVLKDVGWDFLGELDDAFWQLDRPPQPGEERRNWHMTGRAFGVNRNLIAGFPPLIEMAREDIGVNTYWRVYVRVTEEAQSGQLGEPLRRMPWDMLSRDDGDVQAYDQGGRLKDGVPSGYYIDFTQLAEDYGWQRASAGSDWRANFNSINYWLFLKPEGLDWYSAMRELYTDPQLGGFAPTAAPTELPSQGGS